MEVCGEMMSDGTSHLFCPNCKSGPYSQGNQFCSRCGSRLGPAVPPPPGASGPLPPVPPPPGQKSPAGQQPPPYHGPQPVQGYPPGYAPPVYQPPKCEECGGDGSRLSEDVLVCSKCQWLRPLAPDYSVDCQVFQWAQDGAAMAKLRSIGPINKAARTISDKVGRRWIESTFSAVRLGDKQLPDVYDQAVLAARILSMPSMPDLYISGDRMWDSVTYGSETNAFILIGSALISNFRGNDLLFLLAREMGHCRAGHALWKTVIRFLLGERGPRKGLFGSGGGVLSALNPVQLVTGAVEMPLLAWARQAEITADRAGLLAVGEEDIARRVLLSWCLKSSMLYRRINIEAWMEQMDDTDEQMTRLSEVAYSSTPYITRRLKLMAQFDQSPNMDYWRPIIDPLRQKAQPPLRVPAGSPLPRKGRPLAFVGTPHSSSKDKSGPSGAKGKPLGDAFLRLVCTGCKTPLRIPKDILAGKKILKIKCPNAKCGKIVTLKKNIKSESPPSEPQVPPEVASEGFMDSD